MQTGFDRKDSEEKPKHNSLYIKGKHTTRLCGFKRSKIAEVTLKSPLGDPVPSLQSSFRAAAARDLAICLQSLCHEIVTLSHSPNSPALLYNATPLSDGQSIWKQLSYLRVLGRRCLEKTKTDPWEPKHL